MVKGRLIRRGAPSSSSKWGADMDFSKEVWRRGLYSIVRKEFRASGSVRYASYALIVCACCILESDSYAEVKAYAARDNYGYDVLASVGRRAV